MADIFRDAASNKNKISGMEDIIEMMTCLYIHPCYIVKVIENSLLSDDQVFDIISELYEFESTTKSGYLSCYILAALKRDIVTDPDHLDLKRLPTQQIVDNEKKMKKEEERKQRKLKKHNKKKNKGVNKEEVNDSVDSQNMDFKEARPECLFYRLFKFMVRKDFETMKFIYLICIYIVNKVLSSKNKSESDDQHVMSFDLFSESLPSIRARENSDKNTDNFARQRKDKLKEETFAFAKILFDADPNDEMALDQKLDIDDPKQRRLKMKDFDGKREIKYHPEVEDELYKVSLPDETKYLLVKIMMEIKESFKNETRNFVIHSWVLGLLFEEAETVILNYQYHLLPYFENLEYDKNLLSPKFKNGHFFNIKNLVKVIVGYISHADVFKEEGTAALPIIDELNIDLKNDARNKIEKIFDNLVDGVGLSRTNTKYKPEFSCFKKLISHSYDHESISMNLTLKNFINLFNILEKNSKAIFGREEADFDLLYTKVNEFDPKSLDYLKKKKNQVIQINLNTQVFAEEFDDVRK